MSRPRLLFALSADFGEYVTASLFSRNQPFETHYALPRALARYAPPGRSDITAYDGLDDLQGHISRSRPDMVVLASGYLFPVNRIAKPEALRDFVAALRRAGTAVATTDPWLRIWSLRPGTRLAIHSVRQQGVDATLTAKAHELQRYLEDLFSDTPHLFAVPLRGDDRKWMPFFNPEFGQPASVPPGQTDAHEDRWLFVLSKEDFVFLAGFEKDAFFGPLESRIEKALSAAHSRLTFIGPAQLGNFLASRWPREPRIRFIPFCDFDTFEREIWRARVVCYWNTLSSSLLYCLYYRVPPIFFGKGHQDRICPGLFEHVVKHVYCGKAPALLDTAGPFEATTDALIERLGVRHWLDAIAADYSASATPVSVVDCVMQNHGRH